MPSQNEKKTGKTGIRPYRPETVLSPFERMEDMFERFLERPFSMPRLMRMPRMFQDMEPAPTVDIFEQGNNIVVKSEMPGMLKEDIEINLTDDTITISGEKRKEEKIEEKSYFRNERMYGSFCRSFSLPSEVRSDKAKASFKNGVLELKIPKSEEAKKRERKIKIE